MNYHCRMNNWYILPNGNVKHTNGLELQPENDWLPTTDSMEAFADAMREHGQPDALIIKRLMDLAVEGETWLRNNLT